MSDEELEFVYCDAKGKITARRISSVTQNANYIQGFCYHSRAIRTFRRDRVLDLSPANIDNSLAQFLKNAPPIKTTSPTHSGMEVCFTGYEKSERRELESSAKSKGFLVRKSVTVNLDFLCCGTNAGPKKMKSAREKGCSILNEAETKTFLETGEIPL